MSDMKLMGYKIDKVEYINELDNKENQFEIGTSFSTRVNYSDDDNSCICTYILKIIPRNSDVDFGVEIVISGLFNDCKKMDKKDIHVSAANKLFPYLQTLTNNLMNTFGIPGFILQEHRISKEDIVESSDS